ncbi:DNA mismatch repair endonuclease MutL [Opitutaceae bacterium]
MAKVRILPDRVANQIAAGEVIERPAAVVKELVENAVDAGATRVEVEFRHGGRSLIRVEDNGGGMSRDDAMLALERHATSKIIEADDLNRLASFGFRGEALPSIASISRFTLQTRETKAEEGTEIVVNGGRLVHVRECGRPVGTRIEVAQLFNSVPARRKFLKTDQTEAAHIVSGVRLYALAFPRVAFTLIEDGRIIFRSPECTDLVERVGEIFGRQLAEGLVPLSAEEPGLRLTGFIGRPGAGRATRHEMITFVNQRPVDSRTLNYALIESYHESLPRGRYPAAFLFLDIDPAAVDVNVHPAKREVRFRSEPAVRSFVIRAVLQRLRELAPAVPSIVEAASVRLPVAPPPLQVPPSHSPALTPGGAIVRPAPVAPGGAAPMPRPAYAAVPVPLSSVGPAVSAPPAVGVSAQDSIAAWRYVGRVHGTYILFETPAGVVVIDRRAAHERVWFERLQAEFKAGAVASQRLLLPVPVELDPVATALLLDRLTFLNAHGFEISEFGRNFFRIEAAPAWMEPAAAEPFLRDLLGAIRDGRFPEGAVDLARDELARLAVAKAIRLSDVAGEADSRALVTQLFACRSPLTSPSGRPTQVELSLGELSRRFQK